MAVERDILFYHLVVVLREQQLSEHRCLADKSSLCLCVTVRVGRFSHLPLCLLFLVVGFLRTLKDKVDQRRKKVDDAPRFKVVQKVP